MRGFHHITYDGHKRWRRQQRYVRAGVSGGLALVGFLGLGFGMDLFRVPARPAPEPALVPVHSTLGLPEDAPAGVSPSRLKLDVSGDTAAAMVGASFSARSRSGRP